MQVTLSPVLGFCATDAHRLSAGIWCADPGLDLIGDPIHPHPFLNQNIWRSACELAPIVYDDAIVAIATFLDAYHKTSFGRPYWQQVLGWFVHIVTEVSIERSMLLKDISVQHPGAVFIGLDPACEERPIDTKNFTEALRHSHLANLQLMSQIALHLGLDVDTRELPRSFRGQGMGWNYYQEEGQEDETARVEPSSAPSSSVVLYKTLVRKRTKILLTACSFGRIKVLRDLRSGVLPAHIDWSLRNALSAAPCKTKLGALVLTLLARNLPTALLEEWADRARALENFAPYPKVIVSGLGSYWNSDFAIWSAAARHSGSSFIGLQHGGTYGERDACSFEAYEREVSNVYVTWGWSEGPTTVSLPAPRLTGISRRHRQISEGLILWVGTSDSPYVYQLGPRPIGPQFHEYFETQRQFHDGLDVATRQHVLFRPYPTTFGWINHLGLAGASLAIAIDDNLKSFHQRLAEARLVVVDHPGSTTMLEALSANIPVICFGSPDIFDIRPSALTHYDRLAEQGLYYQSARGAALAVNRIAADVPGWWAAPERQSAARAFADNFARRDGFLWSWLRFLSAQAKV